jgi:hypothetical protein
MIAIDSPDDHNGCENHQSIQLQDLIDLTTINFMPPASLTTSGITTLVTSSHECNLSPPPAPKRPQTIFVQVPDDLVRTFELSLSDDEGENDMQPITEVNQSTV